MKEKRRHHIIKAVNGYQDKADRFDTIGASFCWKFVDKLNMRRNNLSRSDLTKEV